MTKQDHSHYNKDVKYSLHKGGILLKNRVEELRKEKGINQEELANILEVSRQTISSIENGRYAPSIFLAFKMSNFFRKSIEEIFIYEEDHYETKETKSI